MAVDAIKTYNTLTDGGLSPEAATLIADLEARIDALENP